MWLSTVICDTCKADVTFSSPDEELPKGWINRKIFGFDMEKNLHFCSEQCKDVLINKIKEVIKV